MYSPRDVHITATPQNIVLRVYTGSILFSDIPRKSNAARSAMRVVADGIIDYFKGEGGKVDNGLEPYITSNRNGTCIEWALGMDRDARNAYVGGALNRAVKQYGIKVRSASQQVVAAHLANRK